MATERNGSVAHQRDVPLLHSRRAGEPVAQVTHDIVFHCPVCGQVLLRTDSELFEGGDKRCPRTSCGSDMRLTPRAVGRPPDTREWRRYSCNGQRMSVVQRGRPAVPVGPPCGRKLFDSPTPVGRVWAYCPDPGCQHGWKGTPKAVYLGGGETPAPRITGRAEVVIGGPRLPPGRKVSDG